MDKYGYIGIETLLNFCENSKDHSVTPNDFMRMKRVRMPEQKKKWIPVSEKAHPTKEGKYLVTDDAGGMATVDIDDFIYCDDGSGMWLCSQNVTAWMPYELPEPYREEGD